ncbi:MAG: hypothetical protein JXR81_05410 [Candidatus Goldbacteria bacterium]|nr:hypothetical protein [Candidatus Goldiibacteriota bacterium]
MPRVVSFTVKIENDKRDLMNDFCGRTGIKIQKFLANAIEHEVRREIAKEELMEDMEAISGYENDKNKVFHDEKSVKKRLGL